MTTAEGGALSRLGSRHVVLVVVFAALAAFLPSLLDGFVFDDDPLIAKNPYAHDLSYLGRCFTTDLWDTPDRPDAAASTKFYRPLVCASYALNWKLGGGSAASFHLTNVLMHAGACALAALFAMRWSGSAFGGLLAGLLFAVHPTRSENVIWVSGRTDVLMALLLFGAHALAVSAAARPRSSGRTTLAFVLFGGALLSKEFAVCWPFLLGLEAVGAAGTERVAERRRLWAMSAAAAVLVALYLGVRTRTFPIRPPDVESMALPPLLHAGYVALSLGYYVERLLVPWPQTFHYRPVAIVGGTPVLYVPAILIGAAAAALFVAWLVYALRRDRMLFALLVVTAVLLLPVLNVSYTGFPGTTADRFLYLPLLPLGAALARTLRAPLERFATRPLAPLLVFASGLSYLAINWVRTLDYVSNETIWRHEIEVNPDNPQALGGLAQVLAEAGDVEGAVALLQRAMSPDAIRYRLIASPTRVYLGLLELSGQTIADGNVPALEALRRQLGALVEDRPPDRVLRLDDRRLVAPLEDEHFGVHAANVKEHLAGAGALLASRLGDAEGVHAFARHVGPLAPLGAPGFYNLALALGRVGDADGARAALRRAVELDPSEGLAGAAADLQKRVDEVRALRAQDDGSVAGRVRVGAALLDLGAYLSAARELRPAYLSSRDPAAGKTYLEALVEARLDADAARVAAELFGPERAPAELDALRAKLSPRTRKAQPAPPNVAW